jgi:hypothetical protein
MASWPRGLIAYGQKNTIPLIPQLPNQNAGRSRDRRPFPSPQPESASSESPFGVLTLLAFGRYWQFMAPAAVAGGTAAAVP